MHHYNDTAKKYTMKKYKWDEETYKKIDWISHKKSFQNIPLYKNRQGTKLIHDYLPIGKLNFTLNDKCPYCEQIETKIQHHHHQDHFILCQKNDIKKKSAFARPPVCPQEPSNTYVRWAMLFDTFPEWPPRHFETAFEQ